MQSHPTNNTKLYRSSQLLHQHSERSRQQHDSSSRANAGSSSQPLPSPPGLCLRSGAPCGLAGAAAALPLSPARVWQQSRRPLCWHGKSRVSPAREAPGPRLGRALGSQPGAREALTGAGLGCLCHPVPQARLSHHRQPALALQLPWGQDEPPPHPMGTLQNLTTS